MKIKFCVFVLMLLPMIAYPQTTVTAEDSDRVVATINNKPIKLSYVYQHIEALTLGDQIDVREELDRFTESVIQEEMLFQYGLLHLEDEDLEIREEIKGLLLERLLDKYVKSRINVTDELVAEYYQNLDQEDPKTPLQPLEEIRSQLSLVLERQQEVVLLQQLLAKADGEVELVRYLTSDESSPAE